MYPFQHICRRVYCPIGDFMIECRCVQLLRQLVGMPVLLTVKVIPRSGNLGKSLTEKQIPNYHKALVRTLQTISENIDVDCIGLFECKSSSNDYYLSVVLVRSHHGNDTRETMKPFLEHLDNDNMLKLNFIRRTYSVGLTSRIRMWTQLKALHDQGTFTSLVDLDSEVNNPTELFSSTEMHFTYSQAFQVLSPLLYCKQIHLNNTEFAEKDGRLIAVVPPRNITLSCYRRMPQSTARVCIDHYMNNPKNMGLQTRGTSVKIICLCIHAFVSLFNY